MKDNWNLYRGYLHLLKALKKIDIDQATAVLGAYNPTKFHNNFDVFFKDKEGMNIPLVLLPFLMELVQKTFDGSDTTLENLEKYRVRNIDHAMNIRSNIFLELMIAYAQKQYRPKLISRKMETIPAALRSRDKTTALQLFSVEIIPYEDLWDMITQVETKK